MQASSRGHECALCPKAVALKLEPAVESPAGLVKTQTACAIPRVSALGGMNRVGNAHFQWGSW